MINYAKRLRSSCADSRWIFAFSSGKMLFFARKGLKFWSKLVKMTNC